jgi:hypothetical protein
MFGRNIMLAAAAGALALSAAMPPAQAYHYSGETYRPKPRPRRKLKALRRYHARGSTKKTGAFRYKGSPRAKRASRRGGNPARF